MRLKDAIFKTTSELCIPHVQTSNLEHCVDGVRVTA